MNLYIFVLTDACSGPQHYLSVANDKIKSSQILVVYEMETWVPVGKTSSHSGLESGIESRSLYLKASALATALSKIR